MAKKKTTEPCPRCGATDGPCYVLGDGRPRNHPERDAANAEDE